MKSRVNKIGTLVLVIGIVMLVTGIVFAFTVGTVAVPILVSLSILVNSAGITLMRWRP